MNRRSYRTIQLGLFVVVCMLLSIITSALAGDDPSIKGELREAIKASMKSFIDRNTVGSVY